MANDDPVMIGRLPERAWALVLAQITDPDGVLSSEHVRSAVAYARDRRSLKQEMEWLGKADGVQVWRVLEAMGCLAY